MLSCTHALLERTTAGAPQNGDVLVSIGVGSVPFTFSQYFGPLQVVKIVLNKDGFS